MEEYGREEKTRQKKKRNGREVKEKENISVGGKRRL
jgi:hypothetical protein